MTDAIFYRLNSTGFEALLMQLAHRQNASISTVAEARERLSAFTVADMVAAGLAQAPAHFGPVTRRLWELTYALFVGGMVITIPPPFQAKSVTLVRATMAGGMKQNFLTVGGVDPVPLMVACPHVPDFLLQDQSSSTSFAESADALAEAAHVMIDRVNSLIPAARALMFEPR